MNKRIYLDYGSATPVRGEVLRAMREQQKAFANPSALHKEATEAKRVLEDARKRIAFILGVKDKQVIFTSGSTEANNLAILGFARANKESQIITTKIEHSSILEPVQVAKKEGHKISYLDINGEGFIDIKDPKGTEFLKRNSVPQLVSFAWGNADFGTVQPVRELAKAKGKAILHIDASQVAGEIGLKNTGADMLTISPAKIYGPKGIAALVVADVKLEPIIYGGGQENVLRAGTENVALAVGFATSLELAQNPVKFHHGAREKETQRLKKMRDKLIEKVLSMGEDVVLLTGPVPKKPRLAAHASFAFKYLDGEEIVVRMDERGFAIGTGSACSAQGNAPSFALDAINLPQEYQNGHIRVTPGKATKEKSIKRFVKELLEVVEYLRKHR